MIWDLARGYHGAHVHRHVKEIECDLDNVLVICVMAIQNKSKIVVSANVQVFFWVLLKNNVFDDIF